MTSLSCAVTCRPIFSDRANVVWTPSALSYNCQQHTSPHTWHSTYMWVYRIICSSKDPQLTKQWALEQVLMSRGKGGKPWHMAHQFPTPRREVKGSWTTRAGVRNSDWWDQSGCPPAASLPHRLVYMCPIWKWPDFRWEYDGVLHFEKYALKNKILQFYC